MALEKAWQTDLSRISAETGTTAIAFSRGLGWYVKAFLTGQIGGATQGLWTIVTCSDGVTFNTAGTDLWGATYDPTKIVRAGAGTAHSHITLRGPPVTAGGVVAAPFYLTIDLGTSADYQITLAFSKAAPTGGSITARPTSTDEWLHSSTQWVDTTSTNSQRLYGWLTTEGSFAIGSTPNLAGFIRSGVMFQVLSNARATDAYPACSFVGICATSPGVFSGVTTGTVFNPSAAGTWAGRSANGVATVVGCLAYLMGQVPGGNPPLDFASTGDASDPGGQSDELDMYFLVTTSGWRSYRGRFADLMVAAPSTQGVDPISGTPVSQVIGWIWWPVNGTAAVF